MKALSILVAAGAAAIGLSLSDAAAASQPLGAPVANDATPRLIYDLYSPNQPVQLERTQYFWGGRRYCWYPGGWRGPGWYWCGYGARRGFGWGGPAGWRGWHYRGGGYHGYHGYHGYRGGYHGGYRGGSHHGGHSFHGGGRHDGGGYHGGDHHGGGGHGGGHGGDHHH